ncbi:MAG TPA: asparagine synthase-related protein [Thermoanaerobaculia bacterium]|nr:asparagine synthase-related protein [Thermoanaerobaculia bacterium]
MRDEQVQRVVDLVDPAVNRIDNLTVEDARERVAKGDAGAVSGIQGSFALVARDGESVRLARSLDRPLRYFLAKRSEGPALVASDRIDAIHAYLEGEGLAGQFHPTYTRMVPAHHVVELRLVGCPDPDAGYTRFFTPERATGPADTAELGRRYIEELDREIAVWLRSLPEREPIGVCFSGGVDSGAAFLVAYHRMGKLGMNPGRLKAFTLSAGGGSDLDQARRFLKALDLEMFLEPVEVEPGSLDPFEAVRVTEDYKPRDVECAAVALALFRGIRARYPDWHCLLDGDGGDENLKDYPIEENPELTIVSVVNNPLLYQEGWGVGRMKHSLTYSGGHSRSYTRTWAPLRLLGFEGFSPFTRPGVIAAAESIPFAELTRGSHERLYALKGEIVSKGVEAVTGLRMPVFPKRRFQHGSLSPGDFSGRFPFGEADYRMHLLSRYA